MPTPTPTPCPCDWTPTPSPVPVPSPTPTPAPTGSITLTKQVTVTSANLFRLQVWTSAVTDTIDPYLFLFRAVPGIPEATEPAYSYVKFVTFAEWKNYAVNRPQFSTGYFRTRYADLLFTSLTDLENVWTDMTSALTSLCMESDSLQTVDAQVTFYDMEV